MRYIIKISIYGEFPGSPDHDYYEITGEVFTRIKNILIKRFQKHDTLEEILKEEKL